MDVMSQEVHTQVNHNRSKGHDSQVLRWLSILHIMVQGSKTT